MDAPVDLSALARATGRRGTGCERLVPGAGPAELAALVTAAADEAARRWAAHA